MSTYDTRPHKMSLSYVLVHHYWCMCHSLGVPHSKGQISLKVQHSKICNADRNVLWQCILQFRNQEAVNNIVPKSSCTLLQHKQQYCHV